MLSPPPTRATLPPALRHRMSTLSTKRRTISYLRPTWAEPQPATLHVALRCALDHLTTVDDTELELGGRSAAIRHRKNQANCLLLHIAAWVDDEDASTVPHRTGNLPNEDLDAVEPDDDWDYLNGDGMVLVSDDHYLVMPSGLLPRSIENYIKSLLDHAHNQGAPIPDGHSRFTMTPIASTEIVTRILNDGVKKLNLNVGLYSETASDLVDRADTIIQRIGRGVLDAIVRNDVDRRRIEEADNVTAKLTITIDSRRRGLQPEDLSTVAQEIYGESVDDINIETGAGERISRGSLILKKKVDVDTHGNTVQHVAAWREMLKYFRELDDDGSLDE